MRVDFYASCTSTKASGKKFFQSLSWPTVTPEEAWTITFILRSKDSNEQQRQTGKVIGVEEKDGHIKVWMDMGEEVTEKLCNGSLQAIQWKEISRP